MEPRAIIYAALLALLALGSVAAAKEEPIVNSVAELVQQHPYSVKILLENKHVSVLEFSLRPGQFLPTHASGDRAVYSLSDYELLCIESYEPCQQMYWKGDIYWLRDEPHAVKNVGNTSARFLVVARKASALGKTPPIEPKMDLLKTAVDTTRLLLKNNAMRIMEVTLQPGETQPMHRSSHQVMYSLNHAKVNFRGEDHRLHPGSVHFQTPGRYKVNNVGATMAQYLIFELFK